MSGKRSKLTLNRAIPIALLLFLLLEVLLRTAYFVRNSYTSHFPFFTIQYDYAPLPPWLESILAIQPDSVLFWKYRPDLRRSYLDIFGPAQTEEERTTVLRRFFPALTESFRSNPVVEVSLNSEGFRDENFPNGKGASAFRIVCLGDSWTFGWNVTQEQAYPQRLKALLHREFPRANFEIFNLGVGGYSSYQGLQLLKRQALALRPDVIVVGFAMNDALLAGYRDKDVPGLPVSIAAGISRIAEISESYKLLRYLVPTWGDRPASIGSYLEQEAKTAGTPEEVWAGGLGLQRADYKELEPWTRVGPKDYKENIMEIIHLARQQQADVILLYNQLWNTAYRNVLEAISVEKGVPLIDSRILIAEARRRIAEDLEERLDLRPNLIAQTAVRPEIEVIFRVYVGGRSVPKGIYIVGPYAQLGDMVPNKVAMHDDGTHGDQRAGDGVWSYSSAFPRGTRVFYVYTNSGHTGKWEGLDVPEVREFTVEATDRGERVYRPIESFGKLYLQADSLHTDSFGYDLIARAVLQNLRVQQRVSSYLARVTATERDAPGTAVAGQM